MRVVDAISVEREVKRKRRAKEKAFINRLVSVFGKFRWQRRKIVLNHHSSNPNHVSVGTTDPVCVIFISVCLNFADDVIVYLFDLLAIVAMPVCQNVINGLVVCSAI